MNVLPEGLVVAAARTPEAAESLPLPVVITIVVAFASLIITLVALIITRMAASIERS